MDRWRLYIEALGSVVVVRRLHHMYPLSPISRPRLATQLLQATTREDVPELISLRRLQDNFVL